MRRNFSVLSILVLIIFFTSTNIFASGTNIVGKVTDAETGEALIGANVFLLGTSMGSATTMDGKYEIDNVPAGKYTLSVTYIGYQSKKLKVTIKKGQTLEQNFKLEPVSVKGKEVVVTAQATGQTQAINTKLSSNQIVDVVSAAKIQQLPDANAAESVGRLPGVSVIRSGGEGAKVVIRGLAPQYNEITINGMQMGSSNPADRSTNLSMISSSMLQSIKVSKTVTPDMDANVLGGVVDFEMREARVKIPGVPVYSLQIQGGYNALSNAPNKYNNYKYVGSFQDRVLNNKLGIFAQLEVGRRNLTSNELGSAYGPVGTDTTYTKYLVKSVNLYDVPRDRMRYNGALDIDYRYSSGKIKFMNFFSSGKTESIRRSQLYSIGSKSIYNNLSNSSNTINSLSDMLELQQKLSIFNAELKLGHTYSETKRPDNWNVQFIQINNDLSQFDSRQNVNPNSVINNVTRDPSKTYLQAFSTNNSFARSRAFTASLDLKTNWNISDYISSIIKFGGMFRYQERSYNYDQYDTPQLLNSGGAKTIDQMITSHFGIPNTTQIPMTYFIDPSFNYGTFINGDYSMYNPLSLAKLVSLKDFLESKTAYFEKNDPAHYSRNFYQSTIHNYSGHENHSAFYVMGTFKVGPQLTIIPGVRYQAFTTAYKGIAGSAGPESYYAYSHYDTTVTRNHHYWLPDVTLKYKPFTWFDVRLSYTNTLSYPSYADFVPRIDLSNGTNLIWHNYNLLPAQSKNYDAYFSVYNNSIGLFTVGGFLKNIKDMVYSWGFNAKGAEALPYLPSNIANGFSPNAIYNISTTKNNPYINKVYGIELNWQTHFWYLPGVLSGLVLDVNYTHAKSQAYYPYTLFKSINHGRQLLRIDTTYSDRLIDQPDNIFNLSLGFDYKDFSIRVALLYQDNIFISPSRWPQLKGSTAAYRRWDIAAKQKLPWFNIELFTDLNNINSANDKNIIAAGAPTSIQDYGFTADMGLRVKF